MRLAHVYYLGLKELVSLRHDPVLVFLIVYAFTEEGSASALPHDPDPRAQRSRGSTPG